MAFDTALYSTENFARLPECKTAQAATAQLNLVSPDFNRDYRAAGAARGQNIEGLPALSFREGASRVLNDMGKGMVEEVTENKGRLVKSAALGVLGGAAAILFPEVTVPLAVIGGLVAIPKVAKGINSLGRDMSQVMHPESHSPEELYIAHKHLRGAGGQAVDILAGAAGNVAGGYLTSVVRSGLAGIETSAPGAPVAGTRAAQAKITKGEIAEALADEIIPPLELEDFSWRHRRKGA